MKDANKNIVASGNWPELEWWGHEEVCQCDGIIPMVCVFVCFKSTFGQQSSGRQQRLLMGGVLL